jgi:hypothetical protein
VGLLSSRLPRWRHMGGTVNGDGGAGLGDGPAQSAGGGE